MKKSSTPKKTAVTGNMENEETSKPAGNVEKKASPSAKPAKPVKEEKDEFEEFRIDDSDYGESHGPSGYDDEEDENY